MAKINVYFDRYDQNGYPAFMFYVEGKGSFGCAGSIHSFSAFNKNGIITRYKRLEFLDSDVYEGLERWKDEEMKRIDKDIKQLIRSLK